ncbi:MAG: BON domain-containing protein [Bdellovibrio sp.]|nr:BON domain-containing protein [Bdellovibrio sp.]
MKTIFVILSLFVFAGTAAAAEKIISKQGTYDPTAPRFYSDSDLQSMASRSLSNDDQLSHEARNVNVRVKNGQASLQGFVNTPEEQEILQKKVLAIEGVHSVKDNTSVRE